MNEQITYEGNTYTHIFYFLVLLFFSFQIRQDPRIERTESMLHVRGVTVWDTGTYTCEIEADMENHITLSHFLQVLGKIKTKKRFFIFSKDWSYLIIY